MIHERLYASSGHILLESILVLPLVLLLATAGLSVALNYTDKGFVIDAVRSSVKDVRPPQDALIENLDSGEINLPALENYIKALAERLEEALAPIVRASDDTTIGIVPFALTIDPMSGALTKYQQLSIRIGQASTTTVDALSDILSRESAPSAYALIRRPGAATNFSPHSLLILVSVDCNSRDFSGGLLKALLGKSFSTKHVELVIPRNQWRQNAIGTEE